MSLVNGLDHFNIQTSRPDETIDFYVEVLGLENRPEGRPDFGFPGAWLWAGAKPLVHLVFQDEDPGPVEGPLNHVAFSTGDFETIQAKLDERGLKYRLGGRGDLGLQQLFVKDPNGVLVELLAAPPA